VQRVPIPARADWQAKVEAFGLVWHSADGRPYWNEAAYYRFTADEIAEIERATSKLYAMFIEAGDHIVDQNLFGRFDIPEWCWPLIAESWRQEPPALNYGRFDLGYDGEGPPKLFEFNCDTPTSLLEAAVIQWAWKEECFPRLDQFNSLHDQLVAKWRDIGPHLAAGAPVHFTHMHDAAGEDAVTTAYLMDTARTAGLDAQLIQIADIGWDGSRFVDLGRREIRTLYHLYPWEWLVREPFGRHLEKTRERTAWIEPIWKMIWSNKAILPVLWELFPRHPNLLWATEGEPLSGDFVSKPILAREGANVRLFRDGREIASSGGDYGEGRTIRQGLYELPDYAGNRPVIGSWVVDGVPAGMGIREDGPITGNLASFVPHVIG
jgi:glutathionylspermidine synthase